VDQTHRVVVVVVVVVVDVVVDVVVAAVVVVLVLSPSSPCTLQKLVTHSPFNQREGKPTEL
jgi:hypothetical protein